MDDNELMARLALGHTEALEELIQRHRAWAEGFAESLLQDHALAEDVVQEAFARVYLLRQSYQPTFAFRTYLAVMIRRMCVDVYRRKQRAPALMAEVPEGAGESAESEALKRGSGMRLWQCLRNLDSRDRALLEGYALEGLSYRELSRRSGMTLALVKVRLHRIRRLLRNAVKKEDAP